VRGALDDQDIAHAIVVADGRIRRMVEKLPPTG
jgi:hypothetical protein